MGTTIKNFPLRYVSLRVKIWIGFILIFGSPVPSPQKTGVFRYTTLGYKICFTGV